MLTSHLQLRLPHTCLRAVTPTKGGRMPNLPYQDFQSRPYENCGQQQRGQYHLGQLQRSRLPTTRAPYSSTHGQDDLWYADTGGRHGGSYTPLAALFLFPSFIIILVREKLFHFLLFSFYPANCGCWHDAPLDDGALLANPEMQHSRHARGHVMPTTLVSCEGMKLFAHAYRTGFNWRCRKTYAKRRPQWHVVGVAIRNTDLGNRSRGRLRTPGSTGRPIAMPCSSFVSGPGKYRRRRPLIEVPEVSSRCKLHKALGHRCMERSSRDLHRAMQPG